MRVSGKRSGRLFVIGGPTVPRRKKRIRPLSRARRLFAATNEVAKDAFGIRSKSDSEA